MSPGPANSDQKNKSRLERYIERFPEQSRPVKSFFDNSHAVLNALKLASMFGRMPELNDAIDQALETGVAISNWDAFGPPPPSSLSLR